MHKLRATLTSKGQITLPKPVREALELKRADAVEFELRGDEVVLRPARKGFLSRYGSVSPRTKPEDWRTVRQETAAAVARDVAEEA